MSERTFKQINTGNWSRYIEPRKQLSIYLELPDDGLWFQDEGGVVYVAWNVERYDEPRYTCIGTQSSVGDIAAFEKYLEGISVEWVAKETQAKDLSDPLSIALARIAELESALKPFADRAREVDSNFGHRLEDTAQVKVLVNDLRRAVEVLKGE